MSVIFELKWYDFITKILDLCQLNDGNQFDFSLIEFNDKPGHSNPNTNKLNDEMKIAISMHVSDLNVSINSRTIESLNIPTNSGRWFHFRGEKAKNNHFLAMISSSNQIELLMHKTTKSLLHLKWHFWPRLFYYFNLFLYFLFSIMYTRYSKIISVDKEHNLIEFKIYEPILFLFIFYFYVYEFGFFLSVCLEHRFSFCFFKRFFSFRNFFESTNFILCFVSLCVPLSFYNLKSSVYALSHLFVYIIFLLRLDKFPQIGPFIEVIREIFLKFLRLFPMVLLLFVGFLYSFKIRSDFVPNNLNSTAPVDPSEIEFFNLETGLSTLRLLIMVVAQIELNRMGLGEGLDMKNLVNYIILFLFVFLMIIFLYNLFIGIAVDGINHIVNDSECQAIKIKIDYCLKFEDFTRTMPYLKKIHQKMIINKHKI